MSTDSGQRLEGLELKWIGDARYVGESLVGFPLSLLVVDEAAALASQAKEKDWGSTIRVMFGKRSSSVTRVASLMQVVD